MKEKKDIEKESYQLTYLTRSEIREVLKTNIDAIVRNICNTMKEKNITQEALACAIQSDQPHLSRILSKNKEGITINVIGRIAKALNTTISELSK
jgi:Helix-turn-helix.